NTELLNSFYKTPSGEAEEKNLTDLFRIAYKTDHNLQDTFNHQTALELSLLRIRFLHSTKEKQPDYEFLEDLQIDLKLHRLKFDKQAFSNFLETLTCKTDLESLTIKSIEPEN